MVSINIFNMIAKGVSMKALLENSQNDNNFTLKEAINEAKRCLNCSKPLCRIGCPIENEIPAFIKELANGNIGQASAVIARHSNLPAVCGRVCAHEKQCEGSCVLSKTGTGIKIGKLERFIADLDADLEITPLPKNTNMKGHVAIIGSGPAGLTVAGDLAKLGFAITVFDAQAEPGGVLMYGIPAFRLCKDVVRREIQKIQRLGVTFKNNVLIGRDLSLDQLFNQGFDAIFIGTGNSIARRLDIEGSNLTGILQAKYLLQIVALANQHSVGQEEIPIVKGDTVIVIGAGNVAMDAARTALRIGAASVTVLHREAANDVPALKAEYEAAKQEGVNFLPAVTPLRFMGTNKVLGLQYSSLSTEPSINQQQRTFINADKIIIAIGQKPSNQIISTTPGIEVTPDGFVKTKDRPYGMSTKHGVFSGGDVVHGPATVVLAMKEAKKVATGIVQYVEAKKLMEECGLKIEKDL